MLHFVVRRYATLYSKMLRFVVIKTYSSAALFFLNKCSVPSYTYKLLNICIEMPVYRIQP